MSAGMSFRGTLSFSSPSLLLRGRAILSDPDDSLLGTDALVQDGLTLTFSVDRTVPAAFWDETWSALYELDKLGDVNGDVSAVYFGDSEERQSFVFTRSVEAPSPARASSAWWARIRPPAPDPAFRPCMEDCCVVVLYGLTSETEPDGPHCPSFVIGPVPEGTLADARGGPWDAFAGSTRRLEAQLGRLAPRASDPDIAEALAAALAWVRARPEPYILQVVEPSAFAGDGTTRPRAFGDYAPGFVENDDDET